MFPSAEQRLLLFHSWNFLRLAPPRPIRPSDPPERCFPFAHEKSPLDSTYHRRIIIVIISSSTSADEDRRVMIKVMSSGDCEIACFALKCQDGGIERENGKLGRPEKRELA